MAVILVGYDFLKANKAKYIAPLRPCRYPTLRLSPSLTPNPLAMGEVLVLMCERFKIQNYLVCSIHTPGVVHRPTWPDIVSFRAMILLEVD